MPLHNLIIFKESGSRFVSRQYIHAISKINGMEIEYIDSLDSKLDDLSSIFNDFMKDPEPRLSVLVLDYMEYIDERINFLDDVIIVTSKLSEQSENLFKEHIIEVPKLEDWQIKDYVYSVCEGAPTKSLDKLISLCQGNIDRLDSEISKLSIFSSVERQYLLESMVNDGAFDDLTDHTVFNVTNAILRKDFDELKNYVAEFGRIDINEIGLVTILAKNFKNMISVHLNLNPTPDNTGLDSKQIYAIKKLPKIYSQQQLIDVYSFLCDIDRKLKSGLLSVDMMLNYVMLKVLTI